MKYSRKTIFLQTVEFYYSKKNDSTKNEYQDSQDADCLDKICNLQFEGSRMRSFLLHRRLSNANNQFTYLFYIRNHFWFIL